MKRFQHWAKIANHPNLPLVRFVSFLFLILLEWITSSLGVPLSPSPYRVPIPKTTAFISSNIQKLHALLVSPDKTKTKNTITQVISNQVSTGCGHYILFNESITLADRDLEFFVACPAGFSSFCDPNFSPQNKEGDPGPPRPSYRSATELSKHPGKRRFTAREGTFSY